MAVQQHGVLAVARNLAEEERRAAGFAQDLDLESRDRLLAAPGGHQLGGAIHVAVRLPGGVEERRLVRDADVLRELGDDRIPERCGRGLPGLLEIHRDRLPVGPS